MKKIMMGVICFVVGLLGCSMVAYTIQENAFPNQYRTVLESYFGKYKDNYERGYSIDGGEGYVPSAVQIRYGEHYLENVKINDEESLFNQLERIYVSCQTDELKKRLSDNNINIYIKNAYNAIRPHVLKFDYTKDNNRISEEYSKYYCSSFCIHKGYTMNKLFEIQNALYMVLVCDNEKTANAFIEEIPNVNAMIIITDQPTEINELKIELAEITDYHYIFTYNGKVIENGKELMGKNKDYQDDLNMYEQGTVIYNYNHYVKEQFTHVK